MSGSVLASSTDNGGVDVQPAGAGGTVSRQASRGYLRLVCGVIVAGALAVWMADHQATIDAGGHTLAAADLEWLFLALTLTTVLWVAGAASQLGSVSIRPPLAQFFAVQVAASLVNHVVPGGVGGMTVNVRFLQRAGLTRPAAVAAVGLNALATLVTHLLLIAAVVAVAPNVLTGGSLHIPPPLGGLRSPPWFGLVAPMVALSVVIAVVVVPRRVGLAGIWRRMRAAVAASLAGTSREIVELRTVMSSPARATLLWAGSAASPLLHAVILIAVFRSLSTGVPAVTLALVYLVSSSASALVPSPGGFGALDVTLAAGLVTAGTSSATAIGVVLGYRLVTVWAPLVPGALVFAFLLRRRLI
ncbi:MAG: hypothetical protein QOJ60_2937 [Actinomycetota bacterium]|jgi:uncharacterized membrane protein YbhN (UPF0104 family)|nr:hypothetical protein [Actinomycetota bacterium]